MTAQSSSLKRALVIPDLRVRSAGVSWLDLEAQDLWEVAFMLLAAAVVSSEGWAGAGSAPSFLTRLMAGLCPSWAVTWRFSTLPWLFAKASSQVVAMRVSPEAAQSE